MTDQVETKISLEDLEVAEEQPQAPAYVSGLGEEAAEMHRQIRGEMKRRDISHYDNHSKIPEPGSEVRELEMDRVAAVLQEDMMRIYREQICQCFGLTPEELNSSEFRTEWDRGYSREFANMLALCTPSRLNLTGR